ncbi:AMP-binding protein [Streptomyces sp. NPDC093065]|uniref:AMP-binding protein n=1 Tax=Streptomyces sp. NPDC093065 TaxID=3366021 RepID=UPI003830B0E7
MTATWMETTGSVLHDRVALIAAYNGEAVAVEGPQATLRYRDLTTLADSWAGRLTAPVGSVVALRIVDPTYLAPAFLAVRAAGLVPMLIDPHAPGARTASVLSAAKPTLMMDVQETPFIDIASREPRIVRPDAGYLGFTSGTQGPPKGIVAREQGVAHFVDWEIATLGIRPSDRVAMISPPSFEVIFRELFATLCAGARIVVADAMTRTNPAAMLPWLAKHTIDIVHAVPGLAARWASASPGTRLERLRWTLFAGEPLHSVQIESWQACAPNSRIGNLYGPSETTLAKFFYPVPDSPHPGLQPVGRPLPWARLRQIGAEDDVFQVGIETPDASFGYLPGTASEADEAAFTHAEESVLFRSQDLGALDQDGNLVIKGRLDSRVKRRGVFVDLGAIEESANRLPGVRAAGCVQTGPAAGGAIVLCAETDVPVSSLRKALLGSLGPNSPDRVVALPVLPLSPNGKIDRRSLRALLEAEAER